MANIQYPADGVLGKRLDGRYRLDAIAGTGGMANVYKAYDLKEEKVVAVKILKAEFLTNEELVRRFKNESRAISMLHHDNIVKVFDVSVSEKLQYIVMEYIEGMPLNEYIQRNNGVLTWKITLYFIEQILSAIGHAHEKGVIHRDIKPQNIMLLQDGKLKVMDFGIARLSRSETRTITDKAIGSVHYISPEQAKGDNTDAKADIYSIGIMMYEMLTGLLPFESDSAVSVAIKQISDTAVMPRMINPTIPEALEEITLKAMAKEPSNRYHSTADMLCDIEEFKRNPSVKFEYTYLSNDMGQTKYINKVTMKNNQKEKNTAKKKFNIFNYTLPIMIGMAVAFVVGAAVLVFLIFNISGNPLFQNKPDVELPTFIGMNYDEMQSKVTVEEWEFKFDVTEVFSESFEKGVVVDQSPKPPKSVKSNAKIKLKVSRGVNIFSVPELKGYSRSDAEKALLGLELKVSIDYAVDPSVPLGNVVRTDPPAGTEITSGSEIKIYVSAAKIDTEVLVPNLLGLTNLDDVNAILSNSRLTLGTVSEVENDQPVGTVVLQSPDSGNKVSQHSQVNIQVSIGPPPTTEAPTEAPTTTIETTATTETVSSTVNVTVPTVLGQPQASAEAAITGVGLKVTVTTAQSSTVAAGLVISQSYAGGSTLKSGDTVAIVVSSGP